MAGGLDQEFFQLYAGILGNFYVTAAEASGVGIGERPRRRLATILQKCGGERGRERADGRAARAPQERPISNKSNDARDDGPVAVVAVASNEAPFIKTG